jgi:hypothetical protein
MEVAPSLPSLLEQNRKRSHQIFATSYEEQEEPISHKAHVYAKLGQYSQLPNELKEQNIKPNDQNLSLAVIQAPPIHDSILAEVGQLIKIKDARKVPK